MFQTSDGWFERFENRIAFKKVVREKRFKRRMLNCKIRMVKKNNPELILKERTFIPLSKIYPDEPIECESYKIEKFTISESQLERVRLEHLLRGTSYMIYGLKSDYQYVRLLIKNLELEEYEVMMSDTPMEYRTNDHFIQNANGDVLIFGLGLGMIILPLLQCNDVNSITVVELFDDLIKCVEPVLKPYDLHDKLTIVQGDAMKYHEKVEKGKKFDCIYGDFWPTISDENYPQMRTLNQIWKPKLNKSNPNKFISHWCYSECLKMHKESQLIDKMFNLKNPFCDED